MKVFFSVFFILSCVSIFGMSDGPCGQDYLIITPDNCPEIPEVAPEDNYYGGVIPEYSEEQLMEIDATANPIPYAPLWGTDILVTDQCDLSPRYDIGFDYDSDGYLYVALITSNATNDSVKVYRSTDRGYTWVNIFTLWFAITNPVRFFDFDFRVSKNDTTPDMYFAWIDSSYTSNTRRFWFGKIPVNASTPTWYQFDNASAQTSNLEALAMDINENADPYVVITYSNNDIQWRTTQSTDQGTTWTYYIHSGSADPIYPTCSFSDQTHFHVATIWSSKYHSVYLRNGTISGGYSYVWLNDTTDHTTRSQLYISADKTVSNPNNHIVAVWRYNTGSNMRIYCNISTNAGSSWQGEGIHTLVGDVQAANPYIRFGQSGFALFTALDYQYTDDSLFVCLYGTSNGSWQAKVYPNDYRPSGLLPSVGTYVLANENNGRVVIYRQYAANPVWFDRWNLTNSVEEQTQINPSDVTVSLSRSNGLLTVSFSLALDSEVSINVFDALGRKITTIANGFYSSGAYSLEWNLLDQNNQKISGGRYFVNLMIDGSSITKTVNIF